jgi:hypothetical protein
LVKGLAKVLKFFFTFTKKTRLPSKNPDQPGILKGKLLKTRTMQNKPAEDLSKSRPVLEFLTVANEYCLFFEKAESYSMEDILEYFQKMAPLLYLKGCTLPVVEVADASFNERFVTEEQWEEVFKTLRKTFGTSDVFFHLDHNADSVEASLGDKMADIYQDMKDFVLLFQKNHQYAKECAVAEIRALFPDRWGPALLQALNACHLILYRNLIDPDLLDGDGLDLDDL